MADWSPTMAKLASRNWHGRLVLCRFGYAFFLLLVDRVIACGKCLCRREERVCRREERGPASA